MTVPSKPTPPDVLPDRRRRFNLSPDWTLAIVLIIGLVIMLGPIGSGTPASGEGSDGNRIAVGMTPSDGAITVRINSCGSEPVTEVALKAVDSDLTLWQATAIGPQERYVYVVGQPPTTFLETIPMIETLPRGILLEASIVTDEVHTAQFFFADLLPELWNYGGTYHSEPRIDQIIEESSPCRGGVIPATSGRRAMMLVGFLVAATAGAGLMSRRLVSPEL